MKTVYNYLNKYPEISRKKQGKKTFVNLKDFEAIFEKQFEGYNHSPTQKIIQNESGDDIEPLKQRIEKLQTAYKEEVEKTTQLERRKNTLEKQVNEYALLFKDEKNEKKELFEQYNVLQSDFKNQIESFSEERVQRAKKYYLALGLGLTCFLIILALTLPQ